MSLSISLVDRKHLDNGFLVIADITFDSSYATGGESLVPAALGLDKFDLVQASAVGGYTFAYDKTNKKLMAYSGATQASKATDLSAIVTRVLAVGR